MAILLILGAMISVQLGAALAKRLVVEIGAQGAAGLRAAIAALILIVIWQPWRATLTRHVVATLLAYGIAIACMSVFFYLAIEHVPLGMAVAVEFLGPLSVALSASRQPVDFVWVAMAATGVYMILPLAGASRSVDAIGLIYALLAAVSWASYIVLGKRAGAAVHPGQGTAFGMAAAAVLTVPLGVAQAGASLLRPSVLRSALVIAILSSAVPYSLEMAALKRFHLGTFGILMSLEPALAALLGYVVLGERLTGSQRVAVACIMFASVGSSATVKRKQSAAHGAR